MLIFTILLIVFMVGLSGLLAATETAITASSPGKIQKLKSEGNKKASLVLAILKVKDKVISTLLIGNSLINTICTTIAASVFIELFGDDIGTILASGTMAIIIIVFAEVVPKAIAVAKAENLTIFMAPFIKIFLKVLSPVNTALGWTIKVFCFIFRINLDSAMSGVDEIRGVIEHQHQEGKFYKYDRDMLGGILDIRDMTVSEIMVHRSNIASINIDLPTEQIIQLALASSHSRIPVWQGNKDNIIGVLYIKNLLRDFYNKGAHIKHFNIKDSVVEPWFVPDNASVIHQLNAFKERKTHFALVVDEYGDLQGMITLEDILEEIVGQIEDEYDKSANNITKISDSEFLIDGATTIRDANRELSWDLPDEDANTIAGLIIHKLERIPTQDEVIEIYNRKITITKKTKNRIKTVLVKVLPELVEEEKE